MKSRILTNILLTIVSVCLVVTIVIFKTDRERETGRVQRGYQFREYQFDKASGVFSYYSPESKKWGKITTEGELRRLRLKELLDEAEKRGLLTSEERERLEKIEQEEKEILERIKQRIEEKRKMGKGLFDDWALEGLDDLIR